MGKLVGTEKRKHDRDLRQKSREQKALTALKKFCPKLFHPKPVADNFEQMWEKVEAELFKKLGKFEYASVIKYLSNFLDNLSKEHQLGLPLPTQPIQVKRTRPMRTPKWQKNAKLQIYTCHKWFKAIEISLEALDGDNLYAAIVCSAIYYDGLATPDEVFGFIQTIQLPRPLNRWGNMVYVEFEFDSKNFNTNISRDDDTKFSLRRLYLSPFTLSLFNIMRKRRQNGEQWISPKTLKSCWYMIRNYMRCFGEIPSSFKLFCKSAVAVTEFGGGLCISQALLEYATGRNDSYSLPSGNQRRLLAPNIKPLAPMKAKTLLGIVPLTLPNSHKRKFGRNNQGVYKQLLNVTRETNVNGYKRSKTDVRAALSELLESGLKEYEFRLVHWLMYLSIKKEVSSIRRYTSAIAKEWLAYSESQELDEMSSSDYWDWYSQLIEISESDKTKKYNAGRYQQFHQYCAAHFSVPVLEEPLPYANDAEIRLHTRAGFIDETLFHALLLAIENFTDFTDKDKLQYQCIAIISYRCGLRISEILKLKINDIEKSDVGWITVRVNNYGNNKTPAAYRRVPLISMLVTHQQKDELKAISEYSKISALLRERRARANNSNTLLFFRSGNTGMKLVQSNVSRVIKMLLVHLSGLDHWVTHHLRHSCDSRLELLIHVDDLKEEVASGIFREILPYDEDKCHEIIDLICTKNKRDRYWAIASFSGHSSPEVTFRSYFHFSDMILGYLVNQRSDKYGQGFLHNLSSISRKKLRNIAGSNQDVQLTQIVPELLEQVKKLVKKPPKRHRYEASGITVIKKRISIDTCYQVLKCYELGISPQELLYTYQITEKELEKWLKNACYIRDLETIKGNSRFNSKDRAHRLLPARLNHRTEELYVIRFVDAMRNFYSTNKLAFDWAFNYCLNHHAMEHGIYFNNPDELQKFIMAFDGFIPKSHWRIATRSIELHNNSNQWLEVLRKLRLTKQVISSSKGRTGHGGVYLKLANPQKPSETSPLLSYMLRMAMIMMMDLNTKNK